MAADKNIPILIADGNKATLRIVRKLLGQLGFTQVAEAADGEQALRAIETADPPFGLVIADWDLPPFGGLELLKRVRASEALGPLRFILSAGECRMEDVLAAKQAGVSHFIAKPFTTVTLRNTLSGVLKRGAGPALGN